MGDGEGLVPSRAVVMGWPWPEPVIGRPSRAPMTGVRRSSCTTMMGVAAVVAHDGEGPFVLLDRANILI